MTATRTGRRAATRQIPAANHGALAWLRPLRHPGVVAGRRTIEFSVLLLLTLALTFVGLIMVLSASTVTGMQETGSPWTYLERQGLWAFVGLVAMGVVMRLDYRDIARFAPVLMAGTTVMLIAVLIPGVGISANGATRWLGVGPFTIQPSEFAKLSLGLFTADSHRSSGPFGARQPCGAGPGHVRGIVHVRPGASPAEPGHGDDHRCPGHDPALPRWCLGVVARIGHGLVYLRRLPPWRFRLRTAELASVPGAIRSTILMVPATKRSNHSSVSRRVASTASGLGAGRAKWGFLPFAHTDFIFSVIAEELGFIGGLMISLVLTLGSSCSACGWHWLPPTALVCCSLVASRRRLRCRAVINIGAAINVLPISGVTLLVCFDGRFVAHDEPCCDGRRIECRQTDRAMTQVATWAVIAGGGTSGHVHPGLAIAAEFLRRGRSKEEIHFIGSSRGARGAIDP